MQKKNNIKNQDSVSGSKGRQPTAVNGVVRKEKGELALTPAQKKDMSFERIKTGVDRPLLILILILIAIGSIMVFSASYVYAKSKTGDSMYFIKRQILFAALGIFGMLIVMRVPYTTYKKYAWIIFGVSALLLISVLVIGVSEGEAQRWIQLPGGLTLQPSEIMKFALVVIMAWYMSCKNKYKENSQSEHKTLIYDALVPFGLIGVACVLIMLENHLSGTIIVGLIGLSVMIAGGGSLKAIFIAGAVVVPTGLIYLFFGKGYQSNRIQIWLNPEAFPRDGGYQNIQGLYAIGSGGLLGVGLGNSRMKYSYVSQPQNDFIFSIVCEELGFVGAVAIMCLFALLVWRGMVVAMHAPDKFSSLVALGISCKVAIQVLLNIAVVTNTIPNTGISLPFFSYGGTAIVILMLEMGVLLSISRHSYQKK